MPARRIYLDYAAATPMDARVLAAMTPFFAELFGNPSSVYAEGRVARKAMNDARKSVAVALNARSDEIIFTNGVTEAINIALQGVLRAASEKKHVVTIATEHKATLNALEREDIDVTFVSVASIGSVAVNDIVAAIRPDTALVTMMYANNEIGTIAPIAEIGKAIAKHRRTTKSAYPLFHIDAAQAGNYLDLDVEGLHVDMMSLSAGKMGGPKASGVLYIKKGTAISPILFGGNQEHGLRPGTENVAGIVGFAIALTTAISEREKNTAHVAILRDALKNGILSLAPNATVNGGMENRLPNNVNIAFHGVDGEALVMYLDERGIAASTASSCAGAQSMSHVLIALGMGIDAVKSSVRFTLGAATTQADVDETLAALADILTILPRI